MTRQCGAMARATTHAAAAPVPLPTGTTTTSRSGDDSNISTYRVANTGQNPAVVRRADEIHAASLGSSVACADASSNVWLCSTSSAPNARTDRCRTHLLNSCERVGFRPVVGFETDDYVATQALVASGLGVSTLPGLALAAHRHDDIRITRLPDDDRVVEAATLSGPRMPVTTGSPPRRTPGRHWQPVSWPAAG